MYGKCYKYTLFPLLKIKLIINLSRNITLIYNNIDKLYTNI